VGGFALSAFIRVIRGEDFDFLGHEKGRLSFQIAALLSLQRKNLC
jgi:hypothetical protein